ncbi:MAG: multidrug efflux SMR transporter [Bdellovibrionales bacterium]
MNNWFFLLIAGGLEIGFATCLKLSEGFTRHAFTAAFLVLAVLSFYFLSRAIESIPIGTAYAVWTGIGAFGTAIMGMWLFNEPTSLFRILLLVNLIVSIIGLKLLAAP